MVRSVLASVVWTLNTGFDRSQLHTSCAHRLSYSQHKYLAAFHFWGLFDHFQQRKKWEQSNGNSRRAFKKYSNFVLEWCASRTLKIDNAILLRPSHLSISSAWCWLMSVLLNSGVPLFTSASVLYQTCDIWVDIASGIDGGNVSRTYWQAHLWACCYQATAFPTCLGARAQPEYCLDKATRSTKHAGISCRTWFLLYKYMLWRRAWSRSSSCVNRTIAEYRQRWVPATAGSAHMVRASVFVF